MVPPAVTLMSVALVIAHKPNEFVKMFYGSVVFFQVQEQYSHLIDGLIPDQSVVGLHGSVHGFTFKATYHYHDDGTFWFPFYCACWI